MLYFPGSLFSILRYQFISSQLNCVHGQLPALRFHVPGWRFAKVQHQFVIGLPSDQITFPEARKKPNKKPFWLARIIPAVLIIAFAFGIGLSMVAQNAYINNLGYGIHKSKKEIEVLALTNTRLKLEISALTSLSRIENVAIQELQMVAPDDFKYVLSDYQSKNSNYLQIAGYNDLIMEIPKKERISEDSWLAVIAGFITGEKNDLE